MLWPRLVLPAACVASALLVYIVATWIADGIIILFAPL